MWQMIKMWWMLCEGFGDVADVRNVPDLPRYTIEFQFWFFHVQ